MIVMMIIINVHLLIMMIAMMIIIICYSYSHVILQPPASLELLMLFVLMVV